MAVSGLRLVGLLWASVNAGAASAEGASHSLLARQRTHEQ